MPPAWLAAGQPNGWRLFHPMPSSPERSQFVGQPNGQLLKQTAAKPFPPLHSRSHLGPSPCAKSPSVWSALHSIHFETHTQPRPRTHPHPRDLPMLRTSLHLRSGHPRPGPKWHPPCRSATSVWLLSQIPTMPHGLAIAGVVGPASPHANLPALFATTPLCPKTTRHPHPKTADPPPPSSSLSCRSRLH